MRKVCLAEETGELYPMCHFDTELCTKGYFITKDELEKIIAYSYLDGHYDNVEKIERTEGLKECLARSFKEIEDIK